ncbi:carboxypeptidase D [Malassezia sp. CBS 17886]|nr:carboxypeptidase D [Malassezia sp. CBS 17886]
MPTLPAAAAFFVPELPGLTPAAPGRGFVTEAGHLPARPPAGADGAPADNAHLYFLLQRAMHRPRRRKLVVWLNGGPGCSSFDGSMMEIGAWRVTAQGNLSWSPRGSAWNEWADVLYLDQPVGTGFSFVENDAYARSMAQVADEVVYFLEQLVGVFPDAGQYIPYVAHALLARGNQAPVHLAGIAIGNGYIDPVTQSGSEVDMMVESGRWQRGGPEVDALRPVVAACRAALAQDAVPRLEYPACDRILRKILDITTVRQDGTPYCMNAYDMRLVDTSPACGLNWPSELAPLYTYLHNATVLRALHVNQQKKPTAWVECNMSVGAPLHANASAMNASVTLLPSILDAHIPVLLFAGDRDLICNHRGLQRLIDQLTWGGARGLGPAQKHAWTVNARTVGQWQSARNLTWVTLNNASHMPAYDEPLAAHDMMLRFMDVEATWPPGRGAVGNRTRVVVAGDAGDTSAHASASASAQPTLTPVPPQVPPPPATDLYGNMFVLALIVLAVGMCVYMRRRARRPAFSSYHAIECGMGWEKRA